ncbi:MAG: fumarylacetoacetase [Dermatophilaceae bacterium]
MPSLPRTWTDIPADHPFGIATLPYGVFSSRSGPRRVGVRIGERVLDVATAARDVGMESWTAWEGQSLNGFLDQGQAAWEAGRTWLTTVLSDEAYRPTVEPHLHDLADVTMHLPVDVADYVDFYASENHATNLGRILRPDGLALPVNWKHLPIGYHGRAGTVIVSGTDIVRPTGQRKSPQDAAPVFGPSIRLDIETELGFVVGGATPLGTRVSVDEADGHLFGVVLLNDWSARDIQAWEYVPLGPFLGKSFATSISAWVTPMSALYAARVPLPAQDDPQPLPYLRSAGNAAYGLDIRIEVALNGTVVTRPPYASMYWSPTQMLAHMTVNGASLRSGDLFGSGTTSGREPSQRGSLVEITWNGTEPLMLADGSTRGFLQDGDTVTMTAWAPGPDGARIGISEVTGTIVPAR